MERNKSTQTWNDKGNIIDQLSYRIRVAKEHGAKYEVQMLQQELDIQLAKNKIH